MNKMELNDLMVCAFRYALGRRTYIAHTISELLVKYKDKLTDSSRMNIIRDIDRALVSGDFGMTIDKEAWIKLKEELKNDEA